MEILLRRLKIEFRLVYVLIAANLLYFAVAVLLSAFLESNLNAALYILGAEYTPDILQGQLWRLVLPLFLHGGILHLIVNMWAFSNLGFHIENYYGAKKLFAVYMVAGIGGSLLSFLVSLITLMADPLQGAESFSISIGASGAIFGLIGLLLGNNYRNDAFSMRIPVDTNQLWIFVGFNLLLGFGINSLGGAVGIDNSAHMGGLIVGFLLGLFLDPINVYYQSAFKKRVEVALFIGAIALLISSIIAQLIYLFS